MICSLGISNFLEEISSLYHSVVFLYFFALITEEGFLISSCCSLEGMMLKLKLQYFGHLMRRVDSLEDPDARRDWGPEEKGTTEDEMAGCHHGLDGRESE